MDKYLFQYCQKIVILNPELDSVLLAKRQGEEDYNGVFSFIGGKLEREDEDLITGLKREKEEEIGSDVVLKVLPNPTYNLFFTKKDGSKMILPHYAAIFESGAVKLSDEYSEWQWVKINKLKKLESIIPTVPKITIWAKNVLKLRDNFTEI